MQSGRHNWTVFSTRLVTFFSQKEPHLLVTVIFTSTDWHNLLLVFTAYHSLLLFSLSHHSRIQLEIIKALLGHRFTVVFPRLFPTNTSEMEFTKLCISQKFFFMHARWEILSQMISFTELKGERRLKKISFCFCLFFYQCFKGKVYISK